MTIGRPIRNSVERWCMAPNGRQASVLRPRLAQPIRTGTLPTPAAAAAAAPTSSPARPCVPVTPPSSSSSSCQSGPVLCLAGGAGGRGRGRGSSPHRPHASPLRRRRYSTSRPHRCPPPAPAPAPAAPPACTYFSLFPLSFPHGPSFEPTSADTLRREFRQLQARAHPDVRHQQQQKQQQRASAGAVDNALPDSATINSAYQTLLDPLRRAEYILSLNSHGHGHASEICETEMWTASKGQEGLEEGQAGSGAPPQDSEVLQAVFEAEEVADDPCTTAADVLEMVAANEARKADAIQGISRAFRCEDIPAARAWVRVLKFWDSLGRRLKEWDNPK